LTTCVPSFFLKKSKGLAGAEDCVPASAPRLMRWVPALLLKAADGQHRTGQEACGGSNKPVKKLWGRTKGV
jgi:hypothetical protein